MANEFSIAVLISGGGTTLRNLIQKQAAGELDARIALVISSNPLARGLEYAREAGIDFEVFDYRDLRGPREISEPVFAACRNAKVDLVVMAGFLRKIVVPVDFKNRIVNIHPSLIPEFCGKGMYGKRVHKAVLKAGVMTTGCTVHFVDNQFDHGPVIARKNVRVQRDDTVDSLAERVFDAECTLYPHVINEIANGAVSVVGNSVVVEKRDL